MKPFTKTKKELEKKLHDFALKAQNCCKDPANFEYQIGLLFYEFRVSGERDKIFESLIAIKSEYPNSGFFYDSLKKLSLSEKLFQRMAGEFLSEYAEHIFRHELQFKRTFLPIIGPPISDLIIPLAKENAMRASWHQ